MGKANKELKAKKSVAKEAEKATMYKLDVRDYEVMVDKVDEATGRLVIERGRPVKVADKFDVKGSLAGMLFNPELRLTVPESFEMKDLADKIRGANAHVLLDSAEMAKLKRAYDAVKAPPETALECLRRIRDAEKVEVKEDVAENKD